MLSILGDSKEDETKGEKTVDREKQICEKENRMYNSEKHISRGNQTPWNQQKRKKGENIYISKNMVCYF